MQVNDVVSKMNLGIAKQTLNGSKGNAMEILLLGLHQDIVDQLTNSITAHGAIASNRLKQSIATVNQSKEGDISVAIQADFYWKFVNFGVNGTLINRGAPTWGASPAGTPTFKQAILGWIKDKGIKVKPGQTYDDLAFVIMKGVKERGIEARPFFTDVVNDELKKHLTTSISKVLGKAITIRIKDPWQ